MFESNPLNMPVVYDKSVLINDALKKKKSDFICLALQICHRYQAMPWNTLAVTSLIPSRAILFDVDVRAIQTVWLQSSVPRTLSSCS